MWIDNLLYRIVLEHVYCVCTATIYVILMQFLRSAANESGQVASGSHENGTVENSSLLPYI